MPVKIISYEKATIEEKEIVKDIIEKTFEKRLIDNYFNSKFKTILLDESHRGVIILQDHPTAVYMDKFAVLPTYQNMGIGATLYAEALNISEGKMFWRCNPKNSIKEWYFDIATKNNGGCINIDDWIIYWTNLKIQEISSCVDYASKKKRTLLFYISNNP